MPEAGTPRPEYTMGYSPEFLQLLDRRNAQVNAAHLLPHLESGFRLLDFGCGPGTITVGLVEAVRSGEVHGIDMEESQAELARAAAAAFLHAFICDWFFMPRVVEAATQYGLATHEQFERWRIEMDEWKDDPGAVGGLAFGEVVGVKPRG